MLSRIPRASVERRWAVWLLLLGLTQLVDVLTTKADIRLGALEGNSLAAALLAARGFAGLLLVKLALVAAMAAAVVLVRRYAREHPGARSGLAQVVVWRGLQICVVVLALTGLHNVLVLARLQGWDAPTLFSTLPLIGS